MPSRNGLHDATDDERVVFSDLERPQLTLLSAKIWARIGRDMTAA
jgi:hypothetical protein